MTSILPTHGSSFYDGSRRGKQGPTLLRRLFRFPQMDFEVMKASLITIEM